MNKQEIIKELKNFNERLCTEVLNAFETRSDAYGKERFSTWRRKFSQFLDVNLPGETSVLNAKLEHTILCSLRGESDAEQFQRQDGNPVYSYIDSLILDIKNDEYNIREIQNEKNKVKSSNEDLKKFNKVFIVHGHDNYSKEQTARFIEKLGFEAIIIHEQANRGKTIIEKIEEYSNVGFAIVLYTPDDLGNSKLEAEKEILKERNEGCRL